MSGFWDMDKKVAGAQAILDADYAELARWRAFGVIVWEKCEYENEDAYPCSDGLVPVPRLQLAMSGPSLIPCPSCGGSGKRLRDGAMPMEQYLMGVVDDYYLFPASWMEPDDGP